MPRDVQRISVCLCAALLALCGVQQGYAQRIGYVDSAYLLNQMPAYQSVQEQLDRMVSTWEAELVEQEEQLEVLRQEFQARELLYTDEKRAEERQEIEEAERAYEQLRQEYFGAEGRLYTEQQGLLRPLQERMLEAVETVAQTQGYDYVLDKSGALLFLYARQEHNLNDEVLRELGIDLDVEETAPAGGDPQALDSLGSIK